MRARRTDSSMPARPSARCTRSRRRALAAPTPPQQESRKVCVAPDTAKEARASAMSQSANKFRHAGRPQELPSTLLNAPPQGLQRRQAAGLSSRSPSHLQGLQPVGTQQLAVAGAGRTPRPRALPTTLTPPPPPPPRPPRASMQGPARGPSPAPRVRARHGTRVAPQRARARARRRLSPTRSGRAGSSARRRGCP